MQSTIQTDSLAAAEQVVQRPPSARRSASPCPARPGCPTTTGTDDAGRRPLRAQRDVALSGARPGRPRSRATASPPARGARGGLLVVAWVVGARRTCRSTSPSSARSATARGWCCSVARRDAARSRTSASEFTRRTPTRSSCRHRGAEHPRPGDDPPARPRRPAARAAQRQRAAAPDVNTPADVDRARHRCCSSWCSRSLRDHRLLSATPTPRCSPVSCCSCPLARHRREINGARLWVRLGQYSFQPSEIAKILLTIFFAGYLTVTRDSLAFWCASR